MRIVFSQTTAKSNTSTFQQDSRFLTGCEVEIKLDDHKTTYAVEECSADGTVNITPNRQKSLFYHL